ncbi:expressed unknown protein [Seminavis robusta]|uniref:Uncharacterized protein n=1 Tax=Seminavis robusta TaxID=568900 RepID=A0A9N8HY52_9STRA|nr:expressed unknown protein [Seminavis robusta]|eukprot:Sro2741_g336021.1  (197) ;mRNA; f:3051-3641
MMSTNRWATHPKINQMLAGFRVTEPPCIRFWNFRNVQAIASEFAPPLQRLTIQHRQQLKTIKATTTTTTTTTKNNNNNNNHSIWQNEVLFCLPYLQSSHFLLCKVSLVHLSQGLTQNAPSVEERNNHHERFLWDSFLQRSTGNQDQSSRLSYYTGRTPGAGIQRETDDMITALPGRCSNQSPEELWLENVLEIINI